MQGGEQAVLPGTMEVMPTLPLALAENAPSGAAVHIGESAAVDVVGADAHGADLFNVTPTCTAGLVLGCSASSFSKREGLCAGGSFAAHSGEHLPRLLGPQASSPSKQPHRRPLVSGSQLQALAAGCVKSGAPAGAVRAALQELQASEAQVISLVGCLSCSAITAACRYSSTSSAALVGLQAMDERDSPSAWEAAVAQMGSLICARLPAAQQCSQLDALLPHGARPGSSRNTPGYSLLS